MNMRCHDDQLLHHRRLSTLGMVQMAMDMGMEMEMRKTQYHNDCTQKSRPNIFKKPEWDYTTKGLIGHAEEYELIGDNVVEKVSGGISESMVSKVNEKLMAMMMVMLMLTMVIARVMAVVMAVVMNSASKNDEDVCAASKTTRDNDDNDTHQAHKMPLHHCVYQVSTIKHE